MQCILQCILTALHSSQRLNQEPMLDKSIGLEKEFKNVGFLQVHNEPKIVKLGWEEKNVVEKRGYMGHGILLFVNILSPGFSRGRR